jgi:dipeptidyl-peptidase-4
MFNYYHLIMKEKVLLFVSLILIIPHLQAQDNQLTVYDCEVGRYSYLNPENKANLVWKTSTGYTFKTEKALIYSEINSKKDNELLNIETLNDKHKDHQIKELSRFPSITWIDEQTFYYQHDNMLINFNLTQNNINQVLEMPAEAENADISPDNTKVAYTVENDLFVNDKHKGEWVVAASDNGNIEFGKSVHRNEFGISKGTYWSPSGKYLAFYRNDQSNVKTYPLVTINQRPATVNEVKYPMAGMASEHVTIGIYNLETDETIFLETGEPEDKYLTNIQWSPDEKHLYVAVLNRDQNHMSLQRFEVSTGMPDKTLFEETHEKYTEPQNPLHFIKSSYDTFIWQSRRDGHNHMYLYNTGGELIKQLTSGPWEVLDYLGQDENGKTIYFYANESSPLDRNLYAVSVSSGEIKQLSNTVGLHQVTINSSGTFIIDSYSNKSTPRKIQILDNKGNTVKNILEADNPLKNYALGKSTVSTIKAADGKTDLYFRMVLPTDFDSTRSYPVVVYVYNGPHVQLIRNSWIGRTELWQHYMAQNGYISFTLDGRGSANRGLEFENITFRELGIIEMEDQIEGIEHLKTLPYVDAERLGVYGWSYGGFMTTSLMVNYPDVFTAGVAGGPVMDWKYYEVMYTERYMDTPQKNPAGYAKTSTLDKADNLQGKLLIIHGAQDPVVVWQHSLQFIRSCVENRKQVDYFIYPTHEHNVRGIDRVHLTEMVSQYFFEHL